MSDKVSPAEFIRQVRQEASRVTLPTRKEVTVSAFMVLVMVAFAALFFMLIDNLASWVVSAILGFGA